MQITKFEESALKIAKAFHDYEEDFNLGDNSHTPTWRHHHFLSTCAPPVLFNKTKLWIPNITLGSSFTKPFSLIVAKRENSFVVVVVTS